MTQTQLEDFDDAQLATDGGRLAAERDADRLLGRDRVGYMERDQYTELWEQLADVGEGDRFRVRYFCPMAKSGQYDRDAYVEREGVITKLSQNQDGFESGADFNSRATIEFETDDGAHYRATFAVGATSRVERRQRKGNHRTGWVRQSRDITGAMVVADA